jgi:hypothetical protein
MKGPRYGTLATGAALAAAAFVLGPVVSWAILVAPHAVFIDARTRSAQVFLINTGSTAEECSVELKFGYPDTDSAGNIFVRLIDSPEGEQARQSAASWIQVYPRRVVVQPGQRQVVRLLASPPAGIEPGEYWTRLIVTSRGSQMAVQGGDSVVRAGVSLVVSTVISVTYRNGEVRTGVRLTDFGGRVEGDSLVVRLGLVREGNAAYLGTARVTLRDAAGSVRGTWDTPIAVYYGYVRRLAFPVEGLARGDYSLHLGLSTRREDIQQALVLPASPIEQSVAMEVR